LWERPPAAICAGATRACASRPEAAPTGPSGELRHGADRPRLPFLPKPPLLPRPGQNRKSVRFAYVGRVGGFMGSSHPRPARPAMLKHTQADAPDPRRLHLLLRHARSAQAGAGLGGGAQGPPPPLRGCALPAHRGGGREAAVAGALMPPGAGRGGRGAAGRRRATNAAPRGWSRRVPRAARRRGRPAEPKGL